MRKRRLPANLSARRLLQNVAPSLIDSVHVIGAQAVHRPGQLAITVPRGRAGGRAVDTYRWAKLVLAVPNETIFDDHLVCRLWNPTTDELGSEDIIVAKPFHLWRSLFDGLTFDFEDGSQATYTYGADYGRTREVDDGAETWDETIHPLWRDGERLLIRPIPATLVGDPTVETTDIFTYSALGSGTGQVTRASGSFVADGFEPGQILTVSGTSLNDGTYTIQSVLALSMTTTPAFTLEGPISSTLTAHGDGGVARWQDCNRAARKFHRIIPDLCLGNCLKFDGSGCIAFDTDVNGTVQATVVNGGSLSIVAGTPNKLRLTLTRVIVTFSRNACGVLVAVGSQATTSITSDLNLDQCT